MSYKKNVFFLLSMLVMVMSSESRADLFSEIDKTEKKYQKKCQKKLRELKEKEKRYMRAFGVASVVSFVVGIGFLVRKVSL